MGVHFYVVPVESVMWNAIHWEDIDAEEARKFVYRVGV